MFTTPLPFPLSPFPFPLPVFLLSPQLTAILGGAGGKGNQGNQGNQGSQGSQGSQSSPNLRNPPSTQGSKGHTKKSGRHRYPLDDLDPKLKEVFESTHPNALPSELVSMVDSEDPLRRLDRDDLIRRIDDKEQAVQVGKEMYII